MVDNGSRRRLGRRAARRARPAVRVRGRRRQPRLRGRRQPGDRRVTTARPSSPCCNADIVVRPGHRGRAAGPVRRRARLGAVGPALRNPDGTQYPSARASRRSSTRPATGCWAACGRATPSPVATASSTPTATDARDVDWVSGSLVCLRRARARFGRRLGRALLHVPGGRRPLLAPGPPRVAGRATTPRAPGARPGREHRRRGPTA